nr:MAG TPA: hypothetical protein [Caudoviricetes sp.]
MSILLTICITPYIFFTPSYSYFGVRGALSWSLKTDTYKRAWPCLHITIPCIISFGVPHLYFSSCNVLIHSVSAMYISDTASCLT